MVASLKLLFKNENTLVEQITLVSLGTQCRCCRYSYSQTHIFLAQHTFTSRYLSVRSVTLAWHRRLCSVLPALVLRLAGGAASAREGAWSNCSIISTRLCFSASSGQLSQRDGAPKHSNQLRADMLRPFRAASLVSPDGQIIKRAKEQRHYPSPPSPPIF